MAEYIYTRVRVADGVYSSESTGEQIVRCRDCEYYHDGTSNGRRYAEPYCLAIGELSYGALFEVDEDNFCSWAKRKEVEDDR